MPATVERFCNLTLTRNDWSAFSDALHRTKNPACVKAANAINLALLSVDGDRMSMDRELEKWKSVQGPAMKVATRQEMGAMSRIIPQISAAEFTRVD